MTFLHQKPLFPLDKFHVRDGAKGPLVVQAVKTRARAGLIRSLADNAGMASQLTFYQVIMGDWRDLFKELDEINAVTAADIKRVANKVFVNSNRTIGTIEPVK